MGAYFHELGTGFWFERFSLTRLRCASTRQARPSPPGEGEAVVRFSCWEDFLKGDWSWNIQPKAVSRSACRRSPRRKRSAQEVHGPYIDKTAAPWIFPWRSLSRTSLACASGKISTVVRTGTRGTILKNSAPSRRVRLATEHTERSSQSKS